MHLLKVWFTGGTARNLLYGRYSGHEANRPPEGYLLAGTELIPCTEAMQPVECASVYSPKLLEHNRKATHYFSAYDNPE